MSDYHDITTPEDRARAREAHEVAVTVSPDLLQLAKLAAEDLVSPSGCLVGTPRKLPNPPAIHVDPRLPARSFHEGPPRP